jgi:hypothetical protein
VLVFWAEVALTPLFGALADRVGLQPCCWAVGYAAV